MNLHTSMTSASDGEKWIRNKSSSAFFFDGDASVQAVVLILLYFACDQQTTVTENLKYWASRGFLFLIAEGCVGTFGGGEDCFSCDFPGQHSGMRGFWYTNESEWRKRMENIENLLLHV